MVSVGSASTILALIISTTVPGGERKRKRCLTVGRMPQ